VARAALEAARKSRKDAQRTLEFALEQQYFQALIARANLMFAGEARATFERTRALQQKRLALGAISDADLAKVDVAALEAQQAMDQAEQALAQAKAQLAFLLGARELPPPFDLEPRQLDFRVPPKLKAVEREALLREARARRPDRQALEKQVERAKASIALSRRQRLPDVTLSLTYAQEGTGSSAISPPTLTLGASLPLPIFYQQQGELVKAEADLRTQDLLLSKLDAQIVSDVSAAAAQLQGARKLVERMEAGGLLARARRARDLVQVQYEKGAASLLDLLDAERTYIASHNEYVQDLGNYWIAVALLEQAVGTELKQ
jgi:cobalt-zinc-cadmium efflux system outer membrane protein